MSEQDKATPVPFLVVGAQERELVGHIQLRQLSRLPPVLLLRRLLVLLEIPVPRFIGDDIRVSEVARVEKELRHEVHAPRVLYAK